MKMKPNKATQTTRKTTKKKPNRRPSKTELACFFCSSPEEVLHDTQSDKPLCMCCREMLENLIENETVLLIVVRDGEAKKQNPFRTGLQAVVRDRFVKSHFPLPIRTKILKERFGFIEESEYDEI